MISTVRTPALLLSYSKSFKPFLRPGLSHLPSRARQVRGSQERRLRRHRRRRGRRHERRNDVIVVVADERLSGETKRRHRRLRR